ncbi:MAG: ABC transporter permease [Planctomycetes bacterium]|nr:ABC transporter permease [Planctomycetota bacterium]
MPDAPIGHAPQAISGVDAMRGVGAVQAKGFWEDAWARVLARPGAVFGLSWIAVIAFFAVFAPLIANAHPVTLVTDRGREWPLLEHLAPADWLLLAGAVLGTPWVFLGPRRLKRSQRLGVLVACGLQAAATVVLSAAVVAWADDADRAAWVKDSIRAPWGIPSAVAAVALVFAAVAAWVPSVECRRVRLGAAGLTAALAFLACSFAGRTALVNFERYLEDERSGAIREVVWAPVPWSPQYTRSDMVAQAPGTRVADVPSLSAYADTAFGARRLLLGSDALGGDVLSQMLWACRLSISIGIVSTGISVAIGITMGALMGYFGGKVDLFLFRIVEIFMAVPVLFLLIVAAGVLPRNTYVMMAIIGCFSWTGAARFTRAEFLKLRGQDFVQAARANGLPVSKILFRHMLPNGITPVLVDASFAVAAAITVEATLSYLGLGPDGQASWGKLLSSATAATGTFVWWLAVFPGAAIFLSVLSYNLLGEAMRDAIDPKLRKAAH